MGTRTTPPAIAGPGAPTSTRDVGRPKGRARQDANLRPSLQATRASQARTLSAGVIPGIEQRQPAQCCGDPSQLYQSPRSGIRQTARPRRGFGRSGRVGGGRDMQFQPDRRRPDQRRRAPLVGRRRRRARRSALGRPRAAPARYDAGGWVTTSTEVTASTARRKATSVATALRSTRAAGPGASPPSASRLSRGSERRWL